MPTYQYACTACGEKLEAVQSFSDPALTVCPNCSGRLRKVFNSVGVVFKGSGFYRNDSRAGNGKANGSADSPAADSSSSASSSSESSSSGSSSAEKSGSSSASSNGSSSASASSAPASSGAKAAASA